MRRPNFLIVGAPKAGTTSLCHYLGQHPHVFMSTPKEPHFLATDLGGYREVRTRLDYEQLFAGAGPAQRRLGEASVFYLYSQFAARHARHYLPDARIIVMLRNPVDLIQSLHAQLVYSRDEDKADLATAWKLNSCRKNGYRIPPRCRCSTVLWYDEIAKQGEQVARWQRYFPPHRIKFVCFDDFVADTGAAYREVLEFLDLPDDGRTSFEPQNVRKRQKSGLLADFTERTPRWLVSLALRTKQALGIERWGVLDRLRRWNVCAAERRTATRSLRAEIRAKYAQDVARLSSLIGRDLSHWTRPRPLGDDSEMGTRATVLS